MKNISIWILMTFCFISCENSNEQVSFNKKEFLSDPLIKEYQMNFKSNEFYGLKNQINFSKVHSLMVKNLNNSNFIHDVLDKKYDDNFIPFPNELVYLKYRCRDQFLMDSIKQKYPAFGNMSSSERMMLLFNNKILTSEEAISD